MEAKLSILPLWGGLGVSSSRLVCPLLSAWGDVATVVSVSVLPSDLLDLDLDLSLFLDFFDFLDFLDFLDFFDFDLDFFDLVDSGVLVCCATAANKASSPVLSSPLDFFLDLFLCFLAGVSLGLPEEAKTLFPPATLICFPTGASASAKSSNCMPGK